MGYKMFEEPSNPQLREHHLVARCSL